MMWSSCLVILFFLTIPIHSIKLCESPPSSRFLRIIGGARVASKSIYPWQAVIVLINRSGFAVICGATVIDDNWLLTAAHCIISNVVNSYVMTGISNISKPSHTYYIQHIIKHPNYETNSYHNDIALIKVKKSLLSADVEEVCLTRNDGHLLSSDNMAIATGFGYHVEKSKESPDLIVSLDDELRAAQLPIIDPLECRYIWQELSNGMVDIQKTQICAGSILQGTAEGDSGGPLMIFDKLGNLVQVGITSFGADGLEGIVNQEKYPGVYTRISPYIDWIESTIMSSCQTRPFLLLIYLILIIFNILSSYC